MKMMGLCRDGGATRRRGVVRFFFFQAEDGIRDLTVTGVQTCALPISARHPDRVLNVGIREQLMVSVGGGLALAGMRPIVHTYAPFLVERAYEQVKLDLGHQGVHAVLVSIGASYDAAPSRRTHQAPEDVALLDSVPGFSVVVAGRPGAVWALLRGAFGALEGGSTYMRLSSEANREARPVSASLQVERQGRRALVVAAGAMHSTGPDAVAD